MFAKQNRLTSREFDTYFKTGRRYHSPALQLIYVKSTDLKVAVVIPKKVYSLAVKRNRSRRQLYHQLRPLLQDKTGIFIFIAKPKIKTMVLEDVKNELVALIGGIGKS